MYWEWKKDHPSGVVDIKAPTTGVITDQQVTNASGVQGLAGSNPFTDFGFVAGVDPLRCV